MTPDEGAPGCPASYLTHRSPHSRSTSNSGGAANSGLVGARNIGADQTITEIEAAGLRGRGGAGFPTDRKWRSVAQGAPGVRYAVANAAEGEPGTFKDRALLRANPYAVVEGLVIAADTIGAGHAFLALKASFAPELEVLQRALGEIESAGWLGDLVVDIVTEPEESLSDHPPAVHAGLGREDVHAAGHRPEQSVLRNQILFEQIVAKDLKIGAGDTVLDLGWAAAAAAAAAAAPSPSTSRS